MQELGAGVDVRLGDHGEQSAGCCLPSPQALTMVLGQLVSQGGAGAEPASLFTVGETVSCGKGVPRGQI